jgi:hypothetical protein
MEFLFAARALWHNKLIVAAGIAVSLAVGVLYASQSTAVAGGAVAWTRVVVDTPKSQLVDAAPSAADSLPWRAQMLVDLMKTEEIRHQLAVGMGVQTTDVDVINPTLVDAPVNASIPSAASKAMALAYAPYVVTATVPNSVVPLIVLTASAADAEGAKRLASVAVKVLGQQAVRPGAYSSDIATGKGEALFEPFDVQQIAPIQMQGAAIPPSPLMPVGVALGFLLAWCGAIVLVLTPLKRRRARRSPYVFV